MRASLSAVCIFASMAGFVALEAAAMHLYPGGTFWDRSTHGADFWQNFLCDLEREVALDGEPNAMGAALAAWAMRLLIVGLAAFWWIVPRLFATWPRLGAWTRGLGLASLVGIAAVTTTPSSRFGALHAVAVVVGGAPGLTAAALALAGLWLAEPKPRVAAVLGTALLLLAFADFALYVRTVLSQGPGPRALPVAQKLALFAQLAWMTAVARRAHSPPLRYAP